MTAANIGAQQTDYQLVENVKIRIRAELDQRVISFPELMNLEVGGVLHLLRPTGENIDVYAENVIVGTGEILVIDGTLAVRLADLRQKHPKDRDSAEPAGNGRN